MRRRIVITLTVLAVGVVEAVDNGLARTPPLGWNSWVTCGDKECTHDVCNEDEVKSVANAMQSNGMQTLGYNYVNLDDCWVALNRTATGALTWDTARFPSGLPALVDWLHARNFRFGLYTSAGNATCSSGGRPAPGGAPGSSGHYDQDAKTFASWGVDYVKLDWCGDIKDHILEGKAAHVAFGAAMNASGRAMALEVVAGYFFMGADVRSVANSWRFCEDHKDSWAKTSEELACRVDQGAAAVGAPGGWAFMDFLMTGGAGCSPFTPGVAPVDAHCPGMSDDEYRTEFSLWSLTQSPLIVATDVRNMTAVMKECLLNREIVELHQSTATPPGTKLTTWLCTEPLKCQVWGRRLAPDGSDWLVALTNLGSKAHGITAEFKQLGWDAKATATVRDLWAHADLDNATGSFASTVPSHGTTLVRITRS